MNLWNLLRPTVRTLEPESMDSPQAAIVYDKVARAHAFLDKLFVRRAMKLGISQGRALDVGCGSGLLSIELSRAAPKLSIFALDLSEAMLELAERNAKEARCQGAAVQGRKLRRCALAAHPPPHT